MLSTEIRDAISGVTFPVTHEYARLTPDLAGEDSGLDMYGAASVCILVTGLADRQFPTPSDDFDIAPLIGRVVMVRPSRPSGGEWFMPEDHNPLGTGGNYLKGARISPDPRNGRFYQELRDGGVGGTASPFILRYNDDAHMADRANESNPWTIVWSRPGLEHQVGRARYTPPIAWVEVRSLETPVTTGLATDEDIDRIFATDLAEPASSAAYIGNATTGHTHGRGHVETEGEHAGMIILDPERVEGELYLTWYEGHDYYDDHVHVQVAGAGDQLIPVGYFNRGVNGSIYYTDDVYTTAHFPATRDVPVMHWAKLALTTTTPATDAAERRENLITQATASHEAFEDLNDALNDLARYQSWCGEYERTMQYIGMRDRRSGGRQPFNIHEIGELMRGERHAYNVSYDVEVTITDESPGYRVSERMEMEYGVSNINSVRFDATVTVTVYGIVAENEEEAENQVTRSQIDDELENQIDGSYEMNDYEHSETVEDTDFDWDNYDD